ncbi:MAG: ABC transporter permease [Alphaproteobacteria bacterium]|nr:ABC transporter permease [Alphaproteobacteria bacterium]
MIQGSLRRIGAVLVKEFLQLRRDRPTLTMMIMVPIIQLILFGYAINTDPKHLPTTVLIRDTSLFSRTLMAGLKNTDYFSIDYETASEREAYERLQKGLTQFVITIPENFSRDLVRGDRPAVLLEADATDPTASSGALASLSGVVDGVIWKDLTGALGHLKNQSAPFVIEAHKLYNPEGFSHYNIVPGLMGVVLMMTGVMMTALALTKERERGTMENLLAMPIHPIEVMAGKIAPYMAIGYVQAIIILSAAHVLFNVPVLGNLLWLSVALLIFIVCNLALGFTVSTGAKNQMQAIQLSLIVFLPSVLLSGFMFPFRGMPEWAQTIGSMLPATYFIRIVRGVLLKGSSFVELLPNLWPLALFTLLSTALTMKVYRRTLD